MTQRIRRILLGVCLLVFIAAAPIAILYAIGYRLTSSGIRPQPVGTIAVSSVPRGANLNVDNSSLNTTPETVSNIIPGFHEMSLELAGYEPWRKKVRVDAGQATEIEARLFPSSIQTKSLAQDIAKFSIAPNRERIAVVTSDAQLYIIDESGATIADPMQLQAIPAETLWSPDSDALLIRYAQQAGIIVKVASQLTQIPSPVRPQQQATWDPRIPDRLLIYDSTGPITAYDQPTQSRQVLISSADTMAVSSRHIITAQATQLRWYSLQGRLEREIEAPLAIDKLYVTPAGNIAVIYTDSSAAVYTSDLGWHHLSNHVQSISWSPDGRVLLLQSNESELEIVNIDNERLQFAPVLGSYLLVRHSRPIRHAAWFAGGRHVIYQIDDQIIILEIDPRDHPIQRVIDSTNTGDALVAVGKDGFALYYLKRTANQNELVGAWLLATTDSKKAPWE